MRHLSLFSGSGIGTLAALHAGIVTVAHAENDPACCYCLERLWPDAKLFRDVRDVTAESVADVGPIDIISGGFPCTDISTAGKGAGLGTEENPTRSGLWFEFARVIRETRPAWVLIENVPALRVRGGDRVTNDLEAMAYEWEAVVVGAWAVGAPHKRDRVWVVGRLADGNKRASIASSISGNSETVARVTGKANRLSSGVGGCRTSWRLADPIGNLCGRGGDEPQRGPEGRTAAGRAGETVGHPASDDQRRAPVAAMHWERKPPGGSSGGCGELADSDSPRLSQPVCERGDSREEQPAAIGSRWPARPGEQQYPWEAPRLVEFGLGDAADGLARRVRSRANKALLRMVGNAWCYPNAVLMFRAIVSLDKEA